MTGRSDSDKIEPDRANTSGRLLFGAALIFAVLATLTLVFTTNTQWLKLAVIAALWAAFFGAMLSVKYRHQAAARASEVADLQAVYELELEREVAARREYELEVEADTRRRIAEEIQDNNRGDITALRAELRAIRENLEHLTGGEVLVERIALRAQATRMRAIGDPLAARAIAAPAPRTPIAPRQPDPRREAPTGQQRGPQPVRVPTQSTGEQSRDNLRPQPRNQPLPRQAGNTGANPIVGWPAGNPDLATVPTRFAAPVARPAAPPNRAAGYEEDSFEQSGRHGSGSYEPVPRPVVAMSATPVYASAGARSSGRRVEPEPAGAHVAGRSVTDLLAAHSSAEDGSRRHRRRAD